MTIQGGRLMADSLTFVTSPSTQPNQNVAAPLAAIVSFEASEPVRTVVEVTDGQRTWQQVYPMNSDSKGGLPVAGFKYGIRHQITIEAIAATGQSLKLAEPLKLQTPPKPVDPALVPPVRVVVNPAGQNGAGLHVG